MKHRSKGKIEQFDGITLHHGGTWKNKSLIRLMHFVKQRDWEFKKEDYTAITSTTSGAGVRNVYLLLDDGLVLAAQRRDTVLESIFFTYPGMEPMVDIAEDIWFPHIHRAIVIFACPMPDELNKDAYLLGAIVGFQSTQPQR